MTAIAAQERAKYEACWANPEYHNHSPGAHWAELFMEMAGTHRLRKRGAFQFGDVIDLGCGAGEGGKRLLELGARRVAFLDQVRVEGVPEPFCLQPLWLPIHGEHDRCYDYGYCCDVMEHLPKEFTMLAASNMLDACDRVFFSISFVPDHFGKTIGEPLHLTVENFTWWRDRLRELGTVIEARDMLGEGVFLVER